MKSKGVAYLLWLFLGLLGGHKFYLNKFGTGILYFFTVGIFGIGWIIDFFTLWAEVDAYNAAFFGIGRNFATNINVNENDNENTTVNNNNHHIVVNVPGYPPTPAADDVDSIADELQKLAALKTSGILTEAEFNAQKAKLLGSEPPKTQPEPPKALPEPTGA